MVLKLLRRSSISSFLLGKGIYSSIVMFGMALEYLVRFVSSRSCFPDEPSRRFSALYAFQQPSAERCVGLKR